MFIEVDCARCTDSNDGLELPTEIKLRTGAEFIEFTVGLDIELLIVVDVTVRNGMSSDDLDGMVKQ
jgi:hypothetical protein